VIASTAKDNCTRSASDTLNRWSFNSYDDAIEDLKRKPRRVVVKPSGSAQSEKVLTYIGEHDGGTDVIALLSKLKEGWKNQVQSFQLQEHATGVEVAVGAFFNGKRFILPACVNFEHKRMFPGEIGPTTGEMGPLCFWDSQSRLVVKGLKPMERKLIEVGYRGYFDINFIATEDRLRPLEFTSRFGYPTINLQIEALTNPWGDLLLGLAKGQDVTLRPKPGFQVAVVVAVPPFPFKDEDAFKKYSKDAVVLFKSDQNGVHPNDVKLVNGDLTGTAGYAVVVTGSGDTVDHARNQAYERIRNLVIPNMFYRTDIGDRWRRDADLLYSWGYLKPH